MKVVSMKFKHSIVIIKNIDTNIALIKKCILALKNLWIKYIKRHTIKQQEVNIKPSTPYYDLEPLLINTGNPSLLNPINGIFLERV